MNKDELWDVIQHNLLRNLSKHGMRKPHIGRWSRPRLKVGPVPLKEFCVPSAIHLLLYGYEDSTPKCWNPSQLWGHELACLHSSMLTSYEGCRARPSLPKSKFPTVWSIGCFKREVEVVSRHLFSLSIVLHLGCSSRTTKYRLKATLLQLTFCPAVLGRNWHFPAIYLPTFAEMSLGFSETQDVLKN